MGKYSEYDKKIIQWTLDDIQMERWWGDEAKAWRKLVRLTEWVMKKEKEYGKERKPAPQTAAKEQGNNSQPSGQGGPRTD